MKLALLNERSKVMIKQNDGGPAFPVPLNIHVGEVRKENSPYDGMTLRDYFAGQALVGLCQSGVDLNYDEAHIASVCGRLADAMLAKREEG